MQRFCPSRRIQRIVSLVWQRILSKNKHWSRSKTSVLDSMNATASWQMFWQYFLLKKFATSISNTERKSHCSLPKKCLLQYTMRQGWRRVGHLSWDFVIRNWIIRWPHHHHLFYRYLTMWQCSDVLPWSGSKQNSHRNTLSFVGDSIPAECWLFHPDLSLDSSSSSSSSSSGFCDPFWSRSAGTRSCHNRMVE